MKKTFKILTILLVVVLLSWQVYQKVSRSLKVSARSIRTAAVAVEVTEVQKSTIRDVGLFTGTLLPRSQFIVAPKIAGRLEKLFVNVGDAVKSGQSIAILDNDEFIQQVEQAQAELKVARANLEESRNGMEIAVREFERISTLRQKKIISQSELDAAEAEYNAQLARNKVAMAQVAQKEAALKASQVRLSYTKIQPAWGNGNDVRVIGERFVDEGAMLAANTPIVSVLDVSSMMAVIHVIERDYLRVREGQVAIVSTDAISGRTFSGKVVRIAPLLKETTRKARVEIEIPNPEGYLKPGMFVRVQIEFAVHDNAAVIPITAIIKRDEREGVFIADLENMKVHFVPVNLGIIDGKVAEVVEPSLSGWVVTMGQHLLEDEATITLPDKEQEHSSSREASKGRKSGAKK